MKFLKEKIGIFKINKKDYKKYLKKTSLKEVKKTYKGEWVLGEVIKENKDTNEIEEIKVLEHNKEKVKLEKIIKKNKGKHLYLNFISEDKVEEKEKFVFKFF